MNRRQFLKANAAGTIGITLTPAALDKFAQASAHSKNKKTTLAIVGTGKRAINMWGKNVEKEYGDYVKFVALCDINRKRANFAKTLINPHLPVYTDFDKMIRQNRPDKVIVTTVDCFHAQYVIRAMQLGCDVICEKPLATDEKQCIKIHEAQKKYKRSIAVTLNNRYVACMTRIKQLLNDDTVGRVYSVRFDEFLDLSHGASYYRRWHGFRKYNGSLFVAKACHHFDLVNWWLKSDPLEVSAQAQLKKYGPNGTLRSIKCRTCPHSNDCKFYFDITKNDFFMNLYVNCEDVDGYFRDACLYRQDLDTWDTNSALVRYKNDAFLSYTLDATTPIEGKAIVINGSKGRIEARIFQRQPWKAQHHAQIRLIPNRKPSTTIYPDTEKGEHGHQLADLRIKDHIFIPHTKDPLAHKASLRDGILASIVGVAAKKSAENNGNKIILKDLLNSEILDSPPA